MKTKILKVEIDCLKKPELEKVLADALKSPKQVRIGKVNTEFILRASEVPNFAETLNDFEVKIADGSGVLWAAKYLSLPLTTVPVLRTFQAYWQMLASSVLMFFSPDYAKEPIPERFPGVEALFLMLDIAQKEEAAIYFFGAEKKVLEKTVSTIKKKYPKLKIVGSHDGYNYKDADIISSIKQVKPELLIVALGSPKQEYWIRDNLAKLESVRVAVGEGGSFDFIAGENKRAPEWMRKSGIEWFWRAFMNQDKTGNSRKKRVWNAVPVFMYTIVKEKIKNEK